jgi:hypothetical protein
MNQFELAEESKRSTLVKRIARAILAIATGIHQVQDTRR